MFWGPRFHGTQGALEPHLLASASQMLGSQGHTTPGFLDIHLLSSLCSSSFVTVKSQRVSMCILKMVPYVANAESGLEFLIFLPLLPKVLGS